MHCCRSQGAFFLLFFIWHWHKHIPIMIKVALKQFSENFNSLELNFWQHGEWLFNFPALWQVADVYRKVHGKLPSNSTYTLRRYTHLRFCLTGFQESMPKQGLIPPFSVDWVSCFFPHFYNSSLFLRKITIKRLNYIIIVS